ncbi:MAG: VC0807 family protein [Verrucomicrobiota bacterium]
MSDASPESSPATAPVPARENPWFNLIFNLAAPILLLTKGADWLPFLTPAQVLIIALLFPVGYFIYDLQKRKKVNGISILGFISVLLTGGIGLLKLSPFVFALKETALPLLIGAAVVISLKTKTPMIKLFLYNPSVMDTAKVDAQLDTPEKRLGFDKVIRTCTLIFASSFLVSSVVNFIVTRMVVKTNPKGGPEAEAAFNAEIGTQTWITWVVMTVLTLPLMVASMWYLFKGIKELTGLGLDDVLVDAKKEQASDA